ncbi:MAG: DJ-1/PfpI family protein [Planctomycetota bacterium]
MDSQKSVEKIGEAMNTNTLDRRELWKLLAAGAALAAVPSAALAGRRRKKSGKPDKGKPKVLMPVGDGTEAVDTLYPFFRIPEDGYEVVVAGPEARLYHMVLHEVPPNSDVPWDITREQPGYHIQASVAFRDVDPSAYVGVFVSGGRAPEYLRYDKDLMRIMRHFTEADKPIAVVCHGIEITSAAGCIRGRTVTTVAKCAMDAEQGGAKYVDRPVVVDGNVVSARTWHDNTPFMKAYMELLNGYVEGHKAEADPAPPRGRRRTRRG